VPRLKDDAHHNEVPYSQGAKHSLELAMLHRREREDEAIETDHLLLGAIEDTFDTAGKVMQGLGLATMKVAQAITFLRSRGPALVESVTQPTFGTGGALLSTGPLELVIDPGSASPTEIAAVFAAI